MVFWRQLLLHWRQSKQTLLCPDRPYVIWEGQQVWSYFPQPIASLRLPSQGWCMPRSRVDIHTCITDEHTCMHRQSNCQGSSSVACPKAPHTAPPNLDWNCMLSVYYPLFNCHAHMYVRSLKTTKARKSEFLLQYNRCVIACVCVCVYIFDLSFLCSARLHSADEGFVLKRQTENLSLSLLQGLPVVCIFPFLLISHLSSHFAPPLPPSHSDFPYFLLSPSHRADSQPGNCMSTGHHTCCCQCSSVWGGGACFLTSMALTPSWPPFASDVNPLGGESVRWRVCACAVIVNFVYSIFDLELLLLFTLPP